MKKEKLTRRYNISYYIYIILIIDCKFKKNLENIENLPHHYSLLKIQDSLYAGDFENDKRKEMGQKISEIIRQTDSALIIPTCQNCHSKNEVYRREIIFHDEPYNMY